jgi:hypothetical protein
LADTSYREFALAGLLGLAALGLVGSYFVWQKRLAKTPEGQHTGAAGQSI